MIRFIGSPASYCDGIHRRSFLHAGFLGLGSLTLPQLLAHRAQAEAAGQSVRKTSVIFIELAGGPTQFETYDPKPDATAEVRGPLQAINTNVTGVQFCELMAEQAKVMDKLAIIRSIHHDKSSHDPSSHLTQTGYYKTSRKGGSNTMPCIGSVTAKLRGANQPGIPPYVALPRIMRNGAPAFLGNAYRPFETGGDPNRKNFRVKNVSLHKKLDLSRLSDRRGLLTALDEERRIFDTNQATTACDEFNCQAFEMVTGERARNAFDIVQEDDKTRDRYGRSNVGQCCLLARRLVEAGVTFVTVRAGGWDNHNKIEQQLKKRGPDYDRGVAALVSDIYDRGLDQDVLIVSMGEFGRTPRINRNAGRDHWGRLMSVLMSGGGLKVGQVVGASNSKGEVPIESPYRPENVLAMVYRHLGIDAEATITDLSGRPRFLLERRELIQQLI